MNLGSIFIKYEGSFSTYSMCECMHTHICPCIYTRTHIQLVKRTYTQAFAHIFILISTHKHMRLSINKMWGMLSCQGKFWPIWPNIICIHISSRNVCPFDCLVLTALSACQEVSDLNPCSSLYVHSSWDKKITRMSRSAQFSCIKYNRSSTNQSISPSRNILWLYIYPIFIYTRIFFDENLALPGFQARQKQSVAPMFPIVYLKPSEKKKYIYYFIVLLMIIWLFVRSIIIVRFCLWYPSPSLCHFATHCYQVKLISVKCVVFYWQCCNPTVGKRSQQQLL